MISTIFLATSVTKKLDHNNTFTNGKAQMDLTLAFENLMDEEEIEKDTNNKKSK